MSIFVYQADGIIHEVSVVWSRFCLILCPRRR